MPSGEHRCHIRLISTGQDQVKTVGVLSSLKSSLNLGYLDDITLRGPAKIVAANIR